MPAARILLASGYPCRSLTAESSPRPLLTLSVARRGTPRNFRPVLSCRLSRLLLHQLLLRRPRLLLPPHLLLPPQLLPPPQRHLLPHLPRHLLKLLTFLLAPG